MRLRIRRQALLVSAIPLAFLFVLLGLALVVQRDTFGASAFAQHSAQVMTRGEEIMKALTAANTAATTYTQTHEPELLQRYSAAASAQAAEVRDLRADVNTEPPAQRALGLRFAANAQEAMSIIDLYLRYTRQGQSSKAAQVGRSPATRRLAANLDASFSAFTEGEQRLAIQHFNSTRRRLGAFGLALILSCAAGLLLTLFVSARFGMSIAQRLERLAENARRLASGKTAAKIEGDDEIAQLDLVYREMTARIQQEHRISSMLQRVLLPHNLPEIAGVRIDTAYVPAAEHTEVGGDWYDVFELADGRICLSVGDVAGHGLRAATVMGTVRLALRTASRIAPDPAAALAHVNRVLCEDHPGVLVTTFVAMLEPQSGVLTYAIAGHPAPICIAPDGSTSFLEGNGLLLGADASTQFNVFSTRLLPYSGLVLYTDGIVEVHRDFDKGLDELCEAVRAQWPEESANIAEGIQQRIFANVQPHDDSALLVVAMGETAASSARPRTWKFDARDPVQMHKVKAELLFTLREQADPNADFAAVELIFGELVGNVSRHTEGSAEVTIICCGDAAELEVRDRGEPFQPHRTPPELYAEGGRGLFLVGACSQRFRVDRTADGNRVTVTLPIGLRESDRPLTERHGMLLG